MTTPLGHPDWAGTQQVHGFNRVLSYATPLAGNASATVDIPFVRPGYVINFRPQFVSTNGANPFTRVDARWMDSALSVDIGPMITWEVPTLVTTGYCPTLGQGPVRGQTLRFKMTNLDPAQSITPFCDMFEASHHIARDDWRMSDVFGTLAPPGFTLAPGAFPTENVLAEFVTTPSALTNYLLPLYAGQAWLSYQIVVPAGQVGELFISPYNNAAVRYFDTGAINGVTVIQNSVAVTLPRKPCFLQINHAGSLTTQYAVTLTTMEYAS